MYWRSRRRNPDTGEIDPTIPAKDANRAGEILMAYDMGKPIESMEVKTTDGPRVIFHLPANGRKYTPPGEHREEPSHGETDGSGSGNP